MNKAFFIGVTMLAFSCWRADATDTYVVGLSAAVDSAEGASINALVDYNFTERASFAVDVGTTRADADPDVIQSTAWDLSFHYNFGPLGIKTVVGQWGDSDEYSANSWTAGLFRESGAWRVSADYISRTLDLTFRSLQNPDDTSAASARSQGAAADISYTSDSGKAFYISTVQYNYNRDVTRLNQFRIARLLSPSALTLSANLLDHSYSTSGDWPVRDNVFSVTLSRDRTAVDRVDVDSVTLGWLTPIGDLTDLDIGVGVSRDNFDTQYFVSLLFLRYGGVD